MLGHLQELEGHENHFPLRLAAPEPELPKRCKSLLLHLAEALVRVDDEVVDEAVAIGLLGQVEGVAVLVVLAGAVPREDRWRRLAAELAAGQMDEGVAESFANLDRVFEPWQRAAVNGE